MEGAPRSASFIIISITEHYSFFLFDADSLTALVVSLASVSLFSLFLFLFTALSALPTLGNPHFFRG